MARGEVRAAPKEDLPDRDVITRRARRQAGHEVLFHLRLVRTAVPGWRWLPLVAWFNKHAATERDFARERIIALIESVAEHADRVGENEWHDLSEAAHRDGADEAWVSSVWQKTAAYLRAARIDPIRDAGHWVVWLAYANLTTLLAAGFSGLAFFLFGQVAALWRNASTGAALGTLGALLALPLISLVVSHWLVRRNRSAKVFWINIGHPPALPPQARPPSGGLGRFRPHSTLPLFLYVQTLLGRLFAWGLGVGASALVAIWLMGGGANTTLWLTLSFLATAVFVARVVDAWDFISPVQLRLSFLILVAGGLIPSLFPACSASVPVAISLAVMVFHVWRRAEVGSRYRLVRCLVAVLGAGAFFTSLETSSLVLAVILAVACTGIPLGLDALLRRPPSTGQPRPRTWMGESKHSGRLIVTTVASLFALTHVIGAWEGRREAWRDSERPERVRRLPSDSWPMSAGATSPNDPVVVVIASGGGSRAALLSALTLERLHEDRALRPVACNIQAVSSVSGGSLTNAVYTSLRVRWSDPCIEHHEPDGWLTGPATRDYVRPTMWGEIPPWTSRGQVVQEDFEESDVVGTVRLSQVVDAWRRNRQASRPLPIPLFNTTTDDGHDLVISPLSVEAYSDPTLRDSALHDNAYDREVPFGVHTDSGVETRIDRVGQRTAVYYREATYGLEDLLPGADLELAQAVRASADFPFGYAPVDVITTRPSWFSRQFCRRHGAEPYHVYLTDGGVLSNSGMWSMFQLLARHVDQLRSRGVILLIVDASKMPNPGSGLGGPSMIHQINDATPVAANLHRRMIDILHARLGDRLFVTSVSLPPLSSHNVMTTWVLPQDKIDQIEADFEVTWNRRLWWQIEAGWSCLRNRSLPACALSRLYSPPLRLPVD